MIHNKAQNNAQIDDDFVNLIDLNLSQNRITARSILIENIVLKCFNYLTIYVVS